MTAVVELKTGKFMFLKEAFCALRINERYKALSRGIRVIYLTSLRALVSGLLIPGMLDAGVAVE
jgi:hypothetical protein